MKMIFKIPNGPIINLESRLHYPILNTNHLHNMEDKNQWKTKHSYVKIAALNSCSQ